MVSHNVTICLHCGFVKVSHPLTILTMKILMCIQYMLTR